MINSNIQDYLGLVRSGKIEVCKDQLLLCDYVENAFENDDIYVNEKQLEEYLDMQKYFPYKLFEWERFCFALHNCTYKSDGSLRWPDILILGGRGIGKNGYLSFEDFCMLTPINGIKNYDIDICANNEDQAKRSFNDIHAVLEKHKVKMQKHFYWNKEIIKNLRTGSILRYRTSNAKTKDGGRPGKIDFDEYHQYENYDSIQVFKTGLGKIQHPRTTITTTNGKVRGGPLDDIIERSEGILKGSIPDNGLLPYICRLDSEDEVSDKTKWVKANPSLPYFPLLMSVMEKEYIDYEANSVSNSDFMTKRMNLPKGNKDTEVTSWENIKATNKVVPDLEGRACVAGIDYAKTTDFVAAGLLFIVDGVHYWITHSWVCRNGNDLSRIKYPLEEAETQGLLTFVDEVEINPDTVTEWLNNQREKYNIVMIAMDSFRYTLLSKSLRNIGFNADKNGANNIKLVRPSDQMLIAPTITSIFVNQNVIWGDNSLMRWYTNNTKIEISSVGNITYGKIEPQSRKTDGFMAFVAAETIGSELDDYEIMGDIGDLGVYTY